MKKKLLSILLTLAMVLTMIPMATGVAFATVDTGDCFYFEVVDTSATIKLVLGTGGATYAVPSLQYSIDGEAWTAFDNTNGVQVSGGKKLYLKANAGSEFNQQYKGENGNYGYYYFKIEGSAAVKIGGNIMTLIDGDMKDSSFYSLFEYESQLVSANNLVLPNETKPYCYSAMFFNCNALSQAPSLPAGTLTKGCYQDMFSGCTALVQAPKLSAANLADSCYRAMFDGCTGLTQAPALPATSLADYCYAYMFNGCTGLTQAPALPATSLTNCCYAYMFNGCTRLTQAPALPATSLADYCYAYMFNGCTGLTQAPALPATSLTNRCYANMFYGCSNLNDITVGFTNWNSGAYTMEWVGGVASTGTFHCPSELPVEYSPNSIPTGWNAEELQPETPTPFIGYFVYDVEKYREILAEAQRQQALIDAGQTVTPGTTMTPAEVKTLVADATVTVRTELTGRGIRVYVPSTPELEKAKAAGYDVVYDFYNVCQKAVPTNDQYKITKVVNKAEPWYLNTAAKMGKKYYYKAVAKVLDKDGNVVATTELSQGKYGCRTMAKFVSTI